MNRKNLTAAVLAGLAGVAGVATTAQAVNLNPDGLGQVLIYPYYTTNDGNQTLLSVVNTTEAAKAVKVRFKEAYNSREVLDFNLYLSPYDVWTAALYDDGGTPTMVTADTSCTVPYIYGMGGTQEFLPYAYTGDNADNGPETIERASEGYFEMIEMGQMTGEDGRPVNYYYSGDPGRMDSKTAVTHVLDTETGAEEPADCSLLVRNWTFYSQDGLKDDPMDGWWKEDAESRCDPDLTTAENLANGCDKTWGHWFVDGYEVLPSQTNFGVFLPLHAPINPGPFGGLFGGASIVNVADGTMVSYDAKAIEGYDVTLEGLHYEPGTIHPSLNDGNISEAYVTFTLNPSQTGPSDAALFPTPQFLFYPDDRSVEAVSAVFMHDNVFNEFSIEESLSAATEWVFTFPTKRWYTDLLILGQEAPLWVPNPADIGCNGWNPGEPYPPRNGPDVEDQEDYPDGPNYEPGWDQCTYIDIAGDNEAIPPFTDVFNDDGMACETVAFQNWNREESPSVTPGVIVPPVVSPAPPVPPTPEGTPFQFCYEVNVMRFGDGEVFGTTSDILLTIDETPEAGWGRVNFELEGNTQIGEPEELHQDRNGLIGLPVTGFSASKYVNGALEGGSVLANYGGIFQHAASTARLDETDCEYHWNNEDICDSLFFD